MSDCDYVTILCVPDRPFGQRRRANKLVTRTKSGEIKKSGAVETGHYVATIVHVPDPASMVKLLNEVGADPLATLMLGFFPDQPVGVPFEVWSRRKLLRRKGLDHDAMSTAERERQTTGRHEVNGVVVYTRTRDNTRLSSWVLFDRDIVRDMPPELVALGADDWLEELSRVFPLKGVAVAIVPSTSGRILIDGRPWSTKASWHAYVQVDDPDDLRKRVWDAALVKAFSVYVPLTGAAIGFMRHSYSRADPTIRISRIGTPWAIWDPTTLNSERLVYDGSPTILDEFPGGGMTLAPPDARLLRDGGRLVTSAFADLSEPQHREGAQHRTTHHTKPGPHGERITVAGLTLDMQVDGEAGPTTIRAIWLSDMGHVRIQSPYRDSTTWAAFIGFHDASGAPFLYDMGSATKYVLAEEDRAGPKPEEFVAAILDWVAKLKGATSAATAAQAARRARAAICAGARHDLPPSAADALTDELAEILAPVYGITKAKLARDLKKDTRQAAKDAAWWAKRTDEEELEQSLAGLLRGFTDEGLAASVGGEWQAGARHVALWGRWLFWDGATWNRDEVLLHMTRIRQHLRTLSEKVSNPTLKAHLESKECVANVASLVRSNIELVATAEQWDADPMLLATPGGTIDLHTGELRPAAARDYLTKATVVAPAPRGTMAPMWTTFLARVTDGDRDLIDYLRRCAGYWMTGLTNEHILFFLYGIGRNGKSTFVETLMWLLGAHAHTIATETLMASDYERHPTDIAELHGVRLAVGSEVEQGQFWAEAKIKKMTGGDRLKGRFMRQDFFDFDPQLKLVVFGNHKPSLKNVDLAIKARLHFVPFTVVIPPEERDKDLKAKLRLEGPAILRWMLDGCQEWQRVGLAPPDRVRAATEQYMADEDHLGQWFAECVEQKANALTAQTALFHDWQSWASTRNVATGSSTALGKELEARGHVRRKTNHGKAFCHLALRTVLSAAGEG